MHGKPTFERKLRTLKANQTKRGLPQAQVICGSWRFEEDSEGNLVIKHLNSDQTIILARP